MNKWKEIWDKKSVEKSKFEGKDKKAIHLELIKCLGDASKGVMYEEYYKQYEEIRYNLCNSPGKGELPIKSVYEIGCGSGAKLFLFENEANLYVGGADYSSGLIESAKYALKSKDLIVEEAVKVPVEPIFDAVFSSSVFQYFDSDEYAEAVLEIMLKKARFSLGIIDIQDKDKMEESLAYRRSVIKNYDEKYKDLGRAFYSKDFFENFAKKHDLEIVFGGYNMKGYRNGDYSYACYMYKK